MNTVFINLLVSRVLYRVCFACLGSVSICWSS